MKIINEKLNSDLKAGRGVKLDLGCGMSPREGFYSVDHLEMPGVDVVADLNKPLDLFPNDCCNYVFTRHTLEHITEFMSLMREIHRITKPGGIIEIIVPHFSNVYAHSDPTHVRLFGLYSMYYFVDHENQPNMWKVPAFYTDIKFKVSSVKVDFYRLTKSDKIIAPIFSKIINYNIRMQNLYERRLAYLYPAHEITYVLRPEK